jgi:hypothetical protein
MRTQPEALGLNAGASFASNHSNREAHSGMAEGNPASPTLEKVLAAGMISAASATKKFYTVKILKP